eukprot:7390070-Prymnesium_polylepis.1
MSNAKSIVLPMFSPRNVDSEGQPVLGVPRSLPRIRPAALARGLHTRVTAHCAARARGGGYHVRIGQEHHPQPGPTPHEPSASLILDPRTSAARLLKHNRRSGPLPRGC